MRSLILCTIVTGAFCCWWPAAADYDHDSDLSLRFDDTSERSPRKQYRLRFKPEYDFDNRWSVHAFVATGDEYDSAYNTIDANDDEFHIRRLFARYENGANKVELGVIPPFKGRVSSTGLSKEGWVRGVRVVRGVGNGALEFVAGELGDLRSSRAIFSEFDTGYFEMEYSASISDALSYELSLESMFDDQFLRGELRYGLSENVIVAAEYVQNASTQDGQLIASVQKTFPRPAGDMKWFTYYSYTGEDFGQRAELTEDFLDFGHALSSELKGGFTEFERLKWFVELVLYEDQSRIKTGIEISLN